MISKSRSWRSNHCRSEPQRSRDSTSSRLEADQLSGTSKRQDFQLGVRKISPPSCWQTSTGFASSFRKMHKTWTFSMALTPGIRVAMPIWETPLWRPRIRNSLAGASAWTDAGQPIGERAGSRSSRRQRCHWNSTNRCRNADRQIWGPRPSCSRRSGRAGRKMSAISGDSEAGSKKILWDVFTVFLIVYSQPILTASPVLLTSPCSKNMAFIHNSVDIFKNHYRILRKMESASWRRSVWSTAVPTQEPDLLLRQPPTPFESKRSCVRVPFSENWLRSTALGRAKSSKCPWL